MTDTVTRSIDWYSSSFEKFRQRLDGGRQGGFADLRSSALDSFKRLGFPTTQHEEWRFTNVARLSRTAFLPSALSEMIPLGKDDIRGLLLGGPEIPRLVFVNGFYSPGLSNVPTMPEGVVIGSLAAALGSQAAVVAPHLGKYSTHERDAFSALNTAFLNDGAFVFLPDRTSLDEPIHLLFIASGAGTSLLMQPRTLLITGSDCRVSFVEHYAGLSREEYCTNAVTEVVVGQRSVIEHDKLQDESHRAYHIGTTDIVQQEGSTMTSNSVSLGGLLVRNSVTAVLGAAGCECTLNGLSLATGQQHVANHTTIDHAQPGCSSHELYKAILDGKSRGVFNGKIFVRRDAQKTDAKQTNKTLLLSDDATINTKPQLEIFADDVKCTHGATIGQLDEEQIFYLRSRGTGLEEARDLLTSAFASDVVNRIHAPSLRERLETMVHSRLRSGRIAGEKP